MLANTLKFIIALILFLVSLNLFSKSCRKVLPYDLETKLVGKRKSSILRISLTAMILTAVLQSSSLVVVVIFSLVQGNILSEKNGLAAVLGTEVGTTATGQIISIPWLKLYPLLLPLLLLFSLPRFRKYLPSIVFFALIIFALKLMTIPFSNLHNASTYHRLIALVNQSSLVGVVIGATFTALVQSSSALTALTISLGRAQIINLKSAIALVLGGNIGTCITGLVAASTVTKKARGIIVGQILFNIIGVALALIFIDPFTELIQKITVSTLIERQIANAHTIFNLISYLCVILVFNPFYSLTKKINKKIYH
ncbi:Na/Pi symporter [Proteinivorax hydrogeniformans]|uniref:Na/Pi symporter n=1 Tax=Proteinivorax hydrogeniformans TaxID=1826727 RepID=A0AAU8HTJ3_9FIRM